MTVNYPQGDSRVEFIHGDSYQDLRDNINEFCEGKFVVGIQYPDAFQIGELTAVVSYKVERK